MVYLTHIFKYKDKPIGVFEKVKINSFMGDYDYSKLAEIIRENPEMTEGFRFFLADVMERKIKRTKRSDNFVRDMQIHEYISDLLEKNKKLKLTTDNTGKETAGSKAAAKFMIGEEVAVRAYSKMKKALENAYEEMIQREIKEGKKTTK